MHSEEEVVPDAQAGREPALNFSYSELVEEIVKDIVGVELQPGDITSSMIVEAAAAQGKRIHPRTARDRLSMLVSQGKIVYVGDHKIGKTKENVYRPVQDKK